MFKYFSRQSTKRRCLLLLANTVAMLLVLAAIWHLGDSGGQDKGDVGQGKENDVRKDFSATALKAFFTVPRREAQRFYNSSFLLDHADACAGRDVQLLVLVKSAPRNADRRQAIRATWGNETYLRRAKGATVKVLFALGAPSAEEGSAGGVQEDLEHEDQLHGDLLQRDFLDSYHNVTLKTVMQVHWAARRCPRARYFMSADDDTVVHTPNLLDLLGNMQARGDVSDLWLGHLRRSRSDSGPIRSRDNKWYVPVEMYPWSLYPPYMSGSGFVLSADALQKIYEASLSLNATISIDDVFVGICASVAGVAPRDHVFFAGGAKAPEHPCIYRQMINSHGHDAQDMLAVWKAATDPVVRQETSEMYCKLVKRFLLCKPNHGGGTDDNGFPCAAAFV